MWFQCQNQLRLSRNVDECTPLPGISAYGMSAARNQRGVIAGGAAPPGAAGAPEPPAPPDPPAPPGTAGAPEPPLASSVP